MRDDHFHTASESLFLSHLMPEQKCLTIDGTQVLWKHYRKKGGDHDIIKFCFGKVLPEKDWSSHKILHEVVSSCTTNAALSAAVRSLAAKAMGATIKAPKDPKSCDCKGHHHPANAPDISDDSSLASSAPVEPQPLVLNGAFSDDLLVVIFGFLELPSLASAAASCASFARVCASEELWQHLVRTAFPLLPARLLPASPGGGGGGGGIAPTPTSPWRNLARLRSQTPHWRLQCNLMDEIESLLVASASTDASPFEGGQHGARLASLAIAVFAHAEGSASASPAGRELVATLRVAILGGSACGSAAALLSDACPAEEEEAEEAAVSTAAGGPAAAASWATRHGLLDRLDAWVGSHSAELDRLFFDVDGSVAAMSTIDARLARRNAIVAAMRCASCLRLLHDEVSGAAPDGGAPASADSWGRWLRIVRSLPEAFVSLEEEGFNIGVPPSLVPAGLGRRHEWWGAEAPVFAGSCGIHA